MSRKIKIQNIINVASTLLENNQKSFRDIFNSITANNLNSLAFISHYRDNSTREFTYKEYRDIVKRVANKLSVLLSSLPKDSVVALKLKNSPSWCFAFWAILMSQHKPLLIDAKLEKDNTEKILKAANAIAIITEDNCIYSITTLTKENINDTTESHDFHEVWSDEVMFCSSGTTGNIKLMIFNSANMLHQLEASKDMPKENLDIIYPQSMGKLRLIGLIPFHHIFAFVSIFLWYSFYNSTIVFTETLDPVKLIEEIKEFKVTHIYHVPLFYEVVMKNFMNKLDEETKEIVNRVISYNLGKIKRKNAGVFINLINNKIKNRLFGTNIKYLISGGGYLNQETSEFINGLGYPLYNGYGMTEIGVTSVELSKDINIRIKRSIGHPLYGVSYKLNDKGELLIKSPTIHIKEIIDGVLSEVKLDEEGYFNSHDVAEVDSTNRYYLKGRLKDVIISSNGENVYPDEIESYFKKIKGINNIAAIGSHNKIILIVESHNKNLIEEFNKINKELPLHKQVNEIIFTNEALPLSSSLKVKRYLVKERYEQGTYKYNKNNETKLDILAAYDEKIKKDVVARLEKVFQKILFVKTSINGNAHWINDLHSDSMSYVTLIGEIEKEFNIKIDLNKYGKLTNLNEFAKEILDSNCK